MRSIPRDHRRDEQATGTAVAPDAMVTVRQYGAARPPYGPGTAIAPNTVTCRFVPGLGICGRPVRSVRLACGKSPCRWKNTWVIDPAGLRRG
jgi:hypothetical protein